MNNRRKLQVALVAGTLAMTALLGQLIWSGYREAIHAAETTTRGYAAILEARLDATLRRADAELQQVAHDLPDAALTVAAEPAHARELNAMLDMRVVKFPELEGIRVFDAGGELLYSTNRNTTLRANIADRDHFRKVRDSRLGTLVFSETLVMRSTGKTSVVILRALRNEQGAFRGVATATLQFGYWLNLFQSLSVGPRGNVALYRHDDFKQVLRWPPVEGKLNVPLPPGSRVPAALAGGSRTATVEIDSSTDRTTRIYSLHALDPYPFFVAVGVARDDVLAGWRQRSMAAALSALLLMTLLVGLLYRLWRSDKVRAGLATIVEATSDAIVSRDAAGKILSWNRGAELLFGYSAAEITGRNIGVIVPPTLRHELRIGQEKKPGFEAREHESVRCAKDGRLIDVSISAAPIRDEAGGVDAVALIFRDITERKQTEQARDRLAAVAEGSNDAIIIRDAERRIVYWNDSAHRLYGYTADEVLGKDTGFLVPPEMQGERERYWVQLQQGIALTNHETVRLCKDGTRVDVSMSVFFVKDRNEAIIGTASIVRDITARKRSERAQAQLAAIVATSNDAIVGRAPDGTIVSWNAAAERIFGWTTGEALGQPFRELLARPGSTQRGRFEKLLRGETVPFSLVDIRPRKDGSSIHVETTVSAVKDEHGKVLFISYIMRDISERIRAELEIEQLATKDALTGLSNRNMLIEQMHTAIARAARAHTQLGVMFVDLDKFKAVNDTLGHTAGDELLRECAERLTDCVREVDIVARLGGDEFMVLLTDITDITIVAPIADRMLKLLSTPYQLHGDTAQTSASIGICFFPADGNDVTTLMRNADIAMYHAKEKNRNNYQFYAEEMNQRMLQRTRLERELRAALENNEFVLHYQPQITIATGAIQGAESLIRWQHPTRGLLSPAEFIPVAEETGLIVPIGEWVLNHACTTIKAWRAKGVGIPYIVVNVSAAQLGEGLVTSVRQALVNHGIEAGWLMLEITETMLMERVEEAISILRRIRELGIRIAMDDFGTGYSSLSVLQRLPLDTLKIDRSFVRAIDDETDNARAVAIIGAIIAIAKELNLSVVAEGVESTTQLAFLRTLNCDTYQGYLYSKPINTMTLEARFAAPIKSVLEDDQGRAITMNVKVTMDLLADAAAARDPTASTTARPKAT
jgi:diguanylate cyclase (GGDEF)-like protein/PAS domain S-box-containing protein